MIICNGLISTRRLRIAIKILSSKRIPPVSPKMEILKNKAIDKHSIPINFEYEVWLYNQLSKVTLLAAFFFDVL
ncbi:hypothetical protein ACE1MK_10200 [Tenacibaculum maritimum]|uniref:hypothetical protein n=1 Tax=Tenacibaculum maritimum TaxID=107401 RepID=UPI0035D11DFD